MGFYRQWAPAISADAETKQPEYCISQTVVKLLPHLNYAD